MGNIPEELNKIVKETIVKLNKFSAEEWDSRSAKGKWSKKEIIGHLIDSAANNHQRFVRVQYEEMPAITYEQEFWVASQQYGSQPAENLINLWSSYNRHLAHIISVFPKDKYNRLCTVNKGGQPSTVTIEWVFSDYISHLKHHLSKITDEN
jgi:hypothetical protein